MTPIYLDNAATTRVDGDIAAAALSAMCEDYGNPSSLHGLGLAAERLVKAATGSILRALGGGSGRLVFTGSGTEANNIALLGAAAQRSGRGRHIVTTAIEHSAVLGPMHQLESQGFDLTVLRPDKTGVITAESVADACRSDTILVSVMAVCNETGALQDIPAMVRAVRARSHHALFHCDAIQAFGKLPVSAQSWGADLISISGHKLHAPKGVGALYLADRVTIRPILYGGGQQEGLRPGTENVPLIQAFGLAARQALARQADTLQRTTALRDQLVAGLQKLPGACINSPTDGSPFIVNASLPGYRSEVLLHFLEQKNIYISSGSACGRGQPSHVLAAMGLPPGVIDSALRISFSYHNTPGDVEALLAALHEAVNQLIKAR